MSTVDITAAFMKPSGIETSNNKSDSFMKEKV